jgi:hypothetical protein
MVATAELELTWTILNELEKELKRRLNDEQEPCLYQAAEKVFAEIENCSNNQMGCASPCDDTPGPDAESQTDSTALAAEIARQRKNLADTGARFKHLIGESDTIKQAVADLKTKADGLVTEVTAGVDNGNVVRWFARWLIIAYWATPERIWDGFGSVAAYLDCLCELLKCLVSGWTTVAILEGRKAELDCEYDAKKQACKKKLDDTLHAILDAYEECWKSKQESDAYARVAPDQEAVKERIDRLLRRKDRT